jgi:hypothetical protein
MPRIAKNRPTQRLNLEMSQEVRQSLERLRDETGADSLAEVIRRSLAVYDFLLAERKRGSRLVVQKDNRERELVLV